eukprot:1192787-Prorocentrum_minimum.AAC.1
MRESSANTSVTPGWSPVSRPVSGSTLATLVLLTCSRQFRFTSRENLYNIASFYGSTCANNGKDALNTRPGRLYILRIRERERWRPSGCTHPPAVDGGALRGEQRRPPTFDHFQQAEGEERAGQDPEGRGGRPEAHVVHDQKWDGGHDGSGRAVWAQLKRRAAGEVSRRTDCVQQTDRQTVRGRSAGEVSRGGQQGRSAGE